MYDYDIKDKVYTEHKKRKAPVVSLTMIGVGLAMIIGGGIYCATTDMSKYNSGGNVKSVSDSIDGTEIKDINITAGFSDINVMKSEDGEVHLEGNVPESYTLNVNNGTLYVDLTQKGLGLNFDLFGLAWDNKSDATLYIPASEYEKFEFDGGAGDITISDITCRDAEISAGAGDININGFTCDTLTIKAGAGELDIDGLSCKGKLKGETGAGDMTVKNAVTGGLDIDLGAGEFEYAGEVNGDIDLDCGVGDCNINLTNDEKEYNQKYKATIDNGVGDADITFNN